MKAQTLLISFSVFLFAIGCAVKPKTDIIENTLPPDSAPTYLPLNLPLGDMDIPALLVGQENYPSGGCFKLPDGVSPESTASMDQLITQAMSDRSFETGLKAEFKKALLDVGLEASITDALTNNVTTEIFGAEIITVGPDEVQPDFTKGTCLIEELQYFVDNRTVITGGIRADSFKVRTSGNLDQSQQAKFDLALEKLNTALKTSFHRSLAQSASVDLSASDVYFGAITSSLASVKCNYSLTLELEKGGRHIEDDFCKGFRMVIERSANFPKRYTFQLTKQGGEAVSVGPMDIEELKLYAFPAGLNRQVTVEIVEKSEAEQEVKVGITLVGVSGAENFR
jgi:hypothetical protein